MSGMVELGNYQMMNKCNNTKNYRVVTHEANYTPPDFGSLLPVDEFDTAEEAIAIIEVLPQRRLLIVCFCILCSCIDGSGPASGGRSYRRRDG